MTTRPSRLMTSRPSRLTSHDFTALAPHGFTAHTLHDRTTLAPHDPRPSRRYLEPGHSTLTSTRLTVPHANCGRATTRAPKSQAHGVRHGARSRLPRVPTHDAKQPGRHLVVCAIPSSSQHLTVCAITSPSRHPTRRVSAGGEGSTPNHPAALRLGMRMGFNPPEQHHTAHSPCKRERTQVPFLSKLFYPFTYSH